MDATTQPFKLWSCSAEKPEPVDRWFWPLRTLTYGEDTFRLAYLYDPRVKSRGDIYFLGAEYDGATVIRPILSLQNTYFSVTSRLVFEMEPLVELLVDLDDLVQYALEFYRAGANPADAATRAVANANRARLIGWFAVSPAAAHSVTLHPSYFSEYPEGVETFQYRLWNMMNQLYEEDRLPILSTYIQFRLVHQLHNVRNN